MYVCSSANNNMYKYCCSDSLCSAASTTVSPWPAVVVVLATLQGYFDWGSGNASAAVAEMSLDVGLVQHWEFQVWGETYFF